MAIRKAATPHHGPLHPDDFRVYFLDQRLALPASPHYLSAARILLSDYLMGPPKDYPRRLASRSAMAYGGR